MKPRFVIHKSSNDQFYFVLRADNSKVILTSETYTAKHNALGGIESVKVNAPHDDRYERLQSKANEPYFVLRAAGNHESIGTSEMYSSAQKREQGIASVKANAPLAEVVDET